MKFVNNASEDPTAGRLSDNDIDQLNLDLLEKSNKDKSFKYEPRSYGCYQICQHKEGALPKILKHLRAERANYKQLLQQEKNKPLDQQNKELISNYDGLQLAPKFLQIHFMVYLEIQTLHLVIIVLQNS